MLPILLVIDDEPAIIRSIRRALDQEDIEFLEAHTAEEGLRLLKTQPVDVILSDEHLPGMQGSQLMHIAARESPDVVRIMVTGRPSIDTTMTAINQGGVYRFLSKPVQPGELVRVWHEAMRKRKEVLLSRELLRLAQAQANAMTSLGGSQPIKAVVGAVNPITSSDRDDAAEPLAPDDLLLRLPSAVLADLSRREREILRSLLAGRWVDEIAQALSISPHTVRNHVKALYRKIGVHSQAELLAKFVGPQAA